VSGLRMLTTSRRDEILSLRQAGLTYGQIGRKFRISKERVRQIIRWKPTQKPSLDSKVMLTTRDVAQLLGLHPNTVRRWSKKGIIKSYCISPRGDRRFQREAVAGFLNKGKI